MAAQRGGSEASAARWPGAIAGSAAQRRPSTGFARLPDRGNLVAYPTQRVVRRDGAYTWHRADLSEAHALAAVADGSLRLTTPTGETLDFAYERHEEHPSGDWTWVGRLERGAAADEIVLTFGDKAAFGTIAQPGREPLRLTIRDGAAWLIETDPARVADIRNRATQPEGPDYLVPPSNASSREADTVASGPSTASASSTAAATSSTAPVIDLVLGYTPGFATMYGGQSQAVTRLNNMVAITNEAYANSQMTGRLRLVHALQVSFADNTDNGATLEKLTGYKSGTGPIATDPAFDALRAARDQYGADLVSLVRKFNDPENSGCGIAWMIGGGGSTIDTGDAPFGYSVVSDGTDSGTDGKTYFCREETLAHEIGHNLGAQHDRATATEDGKVKQGAYSYSFGYKTDSANGNFYTVMAYGDSGQTRYRVFSNPRTTFCGGRACGIADQADNARSHEQAMPVIAQFRATVVFHSPRAVGYDLNRDGRSDLLWSDGQALCVWNLGGAEIIGSSCPASMGASVKVMSVGEYTGDGHQDILVNDGGSLYLLVNTGAGAFRSEFLASYTLPWRPINIGDANRDGLLDLGWLSDSSMCVWNLRGVEVISSRCFVGQGASYSSVLTGDYNGDGYGDLMFGNGFNLVQWSNQGNGLYSAAQIAVYDGNWVPQAVGDFDGDGNDDLGWLGQGYICVWKLKGANIVGTACPSRVSTGFSLSRAGDFNGDGFSDLLFTNGAALEQWVNLKSGYYNISVIANYSAPWRPH